MVDSFINVLSMSSSLLNASPFLIKWKPRSPTGIEDEERGVEDLMRRKMV